MKIHTVKSNAKRAARQLCEKFCGIVVAEPVAVVGGGFHAAVRAADGVGPHLISPEVVKVAMVVDLPPLWVQKGGRLVEMPPIEPIVASKKSPKARAAVVAAIASLSPTKARKAGGRVEQVFAMLRRPEGATVAQVAEACGWLPHTTRAFISVQARKAGLTVTTEKTEAGRVYRIPAAE